MTKSKTTLIMTAIVVILVIVVIIFGYALYNMSLTVEAMKSDVIKNKALEDEIYSIEKAIGNIEIEMPEQNIDQYIRATSLQLNRIEDLLNKVDGLGTIFGVITDIDKSNEIILEVELADIKEIIRVRMADNCTVYMITEISSVPVETEEFIKMLEEDLKGGFNQGFTFKIVGEKAVQIYQGWGEMR